MILKEFQKKVSGDKTVGKLIRSPLLYPTELQAHFPNYLFESTKIGPIFYSIQKKGKLSELYRSAKPFNLPTAFLPDMNVKLQSFSPEPLRRWWSLPSLGVAMTH